MHLKKLLTLVLSFCSVLVLAQSPEVVSASGASFQNSTLYISYTIGECLIGTHMTSGAILSQGFHQTAQAKESGGTPVMNQPQTQMLVYPNPVKDRLILEIEEPLDYDYLLYDIRGSLIERGQVLGEFTEIHFAALQPAVYILRVQKENKELRIFQIVKH